MPSSFQAADASADAHAKSVSAKQRPCIGSTLLQELIITAFVGHMGAFELSALVLSQTIYNVSCSVAAVQPLLSAPMQWVHGMPP